MIELCMVLAAALYLCGYFLIDYIITQKRLAENQEAWDEYSRDMNFDEKCDCFNEWLYQRKLEKGWPYYYYIPKM